MEEQRILISMDVIRDIQYTLDTSPDDWRSRIPAGRSVMAAIGSSNFMNQTNRLEEQTHLVETLQRLAYWDADTGGIDDIADWCLKQWLVVLQNHPQNVSVLRGIGQWWLSKAQQHLARIHILDGSSSSSSGGSSSARTYAATLNRSEEERLDARAAADAEARLHTADYVEARGILLPATEYMAEAVEAATAQNVVNGDLLATAAEAHMSLGNVSYPRTNERYFREALLYLRRAAELPGYRLSPWLQQYLDDYGRFVN